MCDVYKRCIFANKILQERFSLTF